MENRKTLRKNIRLARHKVKPDERIRSSRLIAEHFCQSELFNTNHHIASYVAHDGEIDPHDIMESIWQQKKACYLPSLDPNQDKNLLFFRCDRDSILNKNRYGIPEPKPAQLKLRPSQQLDIVLVPLVAFDEEGNRLGMGAGYYDRSFAFLKNSFHTKPLLIGLAFELQKKARLAAADWDVPLNAVITEKHFYQFNSKGVKSQN